MGRWKQRSLSDVVMAVGSESRCQSSSRKGSYLLIQDANGADVLWALVILKTKEPICSSPASPRLPPSCESWLRSGWLGVSFLCPLRALGLHDIDMSAMSQQISASFSSSER